MLSVNKTETRTRILAFLGALGLFFAAIEYMLPKPVPFIRLGISNIPIVLTLDILKPRELFLLALVKIIGQGILNGTLASYVILFSATGTLLSLMGMLAARKIWGTRISLLGLSLWGAFFSNISQLLLSVFLLFGPNSWIIGPVILLTGLVTGLLVGIFSDIFSRKSVWFKELKNVLTS